MDGLGFFLKCPHDATAEPNLWANLPQAPPYYQWWWTNGIDDARRSSFTISAYVCPSRQSPGKVKMEWEDLKGPVNDYCMPVVWSDNTAWDWWAYVTGIGNQGHGRSIGDNVSPFRPPISTLATIVQNDDPIWRPYFISSWTWRDTIARFRDGTTNQIILLEKHIPAWAIDGESFIANAYNGGVLKLGSGLDSLYSAAKPITTNAYLIARGPQEPQTRDEPTGSGLNEAHGYMESKAHIGSAHPGSFNTLFGDGSVHTFPVTTPATTIFRLCHVIDGESVTLP